MGWTDERKALLIKRWDDGASAAQIAKELGEGVSRNAVLGIVHRAGKSNRAQPTTPSRTTRSAPRAPRPITLRLAGNSMVFHEPSEPRPPAVIVDFKDETAGTATLETLGAYQCKWPIGSPSEPDFTFCGAQAMDGPYCPPHTERARQPAAAKKRSAHELERGLRRYL